MKRSLPLLVFVLMCAYTKAQVTYSVIPMPTGLPTVLTGSSRIIFSDFNGDGDVDALSQTTGINTYHDNNGTGVFTNTVASSGTFTSGPFNGLSFSILHGSVQNLADIDMDGDIDIFEVPGGATRYLRNNGGNYSAQAIPTGLPTSIAGSGRVAFGDYNGDGFTDMLAQTSTTSGVGIAYYQNNGSGSFAVTNADGTGSFSTGPFAGINFTIIHMGVQLSVDIDMDGDLDIFEANTTTRYLQNNGTSFSSATLPTGLPSSVLSTGRAMFADFDGDGDPDALSNGANIIYHQNNGSGSFTNTTATAGTFSSGPFNGINFGSLLFYTLPLQDFDGDGDFDIYDATNSNPTRFIQQNTSPPRVTNFSPANGANAVSPSANIVLTFNENVTASTGNIYIKRLSDNVAVATIPSNSAQVTGSGTNTITINPTSDLGATTAYYVNFDRNAFVDADGVIFGQLSLQARGIGAITANNFYSFTTSVALPVNYLSFTAQVRNTTVLLNWKTTAERNTRHFIVQHKSDNGAWTDIGTVQAAGTSSQVQSYSFTHTNPHEGINLYRLIQEDMDGTAEISKVVQVKFEIPLKVKIYSAGSNAVVEFPFTSRATIYLFNTSGQMVYNKVHEGNKIAIPVNNLSKGIYQVKAVLPDGRQFTGRISTLLQ